MLWYVDRVVIVTGVAVGEYLRHDEIRYFTGIMLRVGRTREELVDVVQRNGMERGHVQRDGGVEDLTIIGRV